VAMVVAVVPIVVALLVSIAVVIAVGVAMVLLLGVRLLLLLLLSEAGTCNWAGNAVRGELGHGYAHMLLLIHVSSRVQRATAPAQALLFSNCSLHAEKYRRSACAE